jgi:hypothetical protein
MRCGVKGREYSGRFFGAELSAPRTSGTTSSPRSATPLTSKASAQRPVAIIDRANFLMMYAHDTTSDHCLSTLGAST